MSPVKGACVLLMIPLLLWGGSAEGARIKDVANVYGVRENQLIGYGLVVGLEGTGDRENTKFTVQSIANMLTRMGITVDKVQVRVRNVAAVIVTAQLPPFARAGSRIDAVVSSLGDAKSLQGGTLLLTPLRGPDQQVYAVAQGAISIGGFGAGRGGTTVQKNFLTVGRLAGGAIVEREVPMELNQRGEVVIALHRPDFSTVLRTAAVINKALNEEAARPTDAGTIQVRVPESRRGKVVELMAALENLEVAVDAPARVVLNERTGTVVMGDHVRLSTVAVAHGNLSIEIKTELQVSQPAPLSKGETVVVPQRDVKVQEQKANLLLLPSGTSLGEVVRALNAVGVTPRDLIVILQAMKAAGALQAELELI